jgi:membrane protease YdiL (CAAX protease family)
LKFELTRIAHYPVPLRLGIFILTLLLIWLPFAIPLYSFLKDDLNLASIVTMGLMFMVFLCLLGFWNNRIYKNSQWLRHYGLAWTRSNGIEWLNGLSLGLLLTLSLFILESLLGWVEWHDPPPFFIEVVAEGLLSALGIGLAEELLFRGWLLDELSRDYSPRVALWANALIFAGLHFIKPLQEVLRTFPQFPALVLLGLTLVWAKRSCSQRLGMSIGIHAGLVWGYYILKVGKLFQYTGDISPWITGIDNNPIAGLMGLIFLSFLALSVRHRAMQKL